MDLVMVEPGVARLHNNPGLAELAHLRSLCTWGALLLAAVAALGSLVRALRKAVRRRIRLHGLKAAAAAATTTGCGGGRGMAAASLVPKTYTVESLDDEDFSERRCRSASCSGNDKWVKEECEYTQENKEDGGDDDDKGIQTGCCIDDEKDNWGNISAGGWDSWLSGGSVVKAWEQDRDDEGPWGGQGGGPFSGIVPLICSFCLEPPNLTFTCSDALDSLYLWDSRLRSCVPAAVIPGPPPALRRRTAPGFGASCRDTDKAVYVAPGRRGGGVVVDLRNTKGVLLRRVHDSAEDEC